MACKKPDCDGLQEARLRNFRNLQIPVSHSCSHLSLSTEPSETSVSVYGTFSPLSQFTEYSDPCLNILLDPCLSLRNHTDPCLTFLQALYSVYGTFRDSNLSLWNLQTPASHFTARPLSQSTEPYRPLSQHSFRSCLSLRNHTVQTPCKSLTLLSTTMNKSRLLW